MESLVSVGVIFSNSEKMAKRIHRFDTAVASAERSSEAILHCKYIFGRTLANDHSSAMFVGIGKRHVLVPADCE